MNTPLRLAQLAAQLANDSALWALYKNQFAEAADPTERADLEHKLLLVHLRRSERLAELARLTAPHQAAA